jgi:hypothetical protein
MHYTVRTHLVYRYVHPVSALCNKTLRPIILKTCRCVETFIKFFIKRQTHARGDIKPHDSAPAVPVCVNESSQLIATGSPLLYSFRVSDVKKKYEKFNPCQKTWWLVRVCGVYF